MKCTIPATNFCSVPSSPIIFKNEEVCMLLYNQIAHLATLYPRILAINIIVNRMGLKGTMIMYLIIIIGNNNGLENG